jgi:EAL domain-containing protein (putative c-di-GMP-specific phosphodiesterase class I)
MVTTHAAGRVLVVDDEAPLLNVCVRALRRAGFEAVTAANGAAAVEFVSQGFDVIVSDIQMPGFDGMELLRRVRERDLDVPVILMTGNPSLSTAVRAIDYGALKYLTKPFDLEELVVVVRDAVRLRRLARAKREALEILGSAAPLAGDRAGLEATFERAMETLWMAYQPIVSVPQRRVHGYEALLRSSEPALPHPGAVLEAAERLDQVHTVGRVVRDRVAARIRETEDEGALFFVNLHAHDLLDASLLSADAALSKVAARVVLEITERAALDELEDMRERVGTLRTFGFRLAVDDLGAGYAGLTSFATIEPDVVKIDMSLIRGMDANPVKRRVVERLTALFHEFDILVVAEGIETAAERDACLAAGCDLLQGYLFAKPGKPFPVVGW